MAIQQRLKTAIEYPTSDGKPMAETDIHVDEIINAKEALRFYFDQRPDVYIAANNFLYYVEGDPKRVVSPDLYVVFGVEMRRRDCYMVWKEHGRVPNVVIEFTSRKTRREDLGKKRDIYERELRVDEYFLFDPRGDYIRTRLKGYRMVAGVYEELVPVDGRLFSEQLRLDLIQNGNILRFYDPIAGRLLPTPLENAKRAQEEADRAREANERAQEANERAQEANERAQAANERAIAEAERANLETHARAMLEAENARLRAELERVRPEVDQ